jgi:hypothetical protein
MKIPDQSGPDRIFQAVPYHLAKHFVFTDSMIVVLAVPYGAMPVKKHVDGPGGVSFKALHGLPKSARDNPSHNVEMIRHDDSRFQFQSSLTLQVVKAFKDNGCSLCMQKDRFPLKRGSRDQVYLAGNGPAPHS